MHEEDSSEYVPWKLQGSPNDIYMMMIMTITNNNNNQIIIITTTTNTLQTNNTLTLCNTMYVKLFLSDPLRLNRIHLTYFTDSKRTYIYNDVASTPYHKWPNTY